MFGIGWIELAIVMTIGVFFMTIFLTVFSAVMKQRPRQTPTVQQPPEQALHGFSSAGRLHFFVVFVLFCVLVFSVPMVWIVLGNQGMTMVKILTFVLLAVVLYGMIALAYVVMTSRTPVSQLLTPNFQVHGDDPATHVDLVARITQRFCPRCRSVLAADAPEGLCPACLMAGGTASAAAIDPANGMAVTTPPSGPQHSTAGEWADLAKHFPQLEILELLGRGGMGAVYKARQKNLDRMIALKVIPPDAAKDPAFAERFGREARALARLNHPNIVTVHDFGQTGDVYYLLMEYVDGVNLRHAMHSSHLQPQEALAIVPQICDALQYAHDQGVVHRDIKPENVLLDRSGRVKIADFGLAKMLGKGPADFTLTGTQQVMGTPRYMAPEQIERPTAVDHRADIYSLGVVLYEMLTGELPLGRFQPPSQKVQVDVRIDQVVLRALEKEPDRRYQRASQVKSELASAAPPTWHTPAPAAKDFSGGQADGDRQTMRGRVQIPAAGLMVTGFIGLIAIAVIFFLILSYMSLELRQAAGWSEFFAIAPFIISAVISFAIALGGWQMWNLKSYGLAVTAAVLAIMPSTAGCFIGLPMGVWAILVLIDPRVRAAFEGTARPMRRSELPRQTLGGVMGPMIGAGCGVVTVGFIVCSGVTLLLVLPGIQAARESARRAQSMNNLKQIGLALHNYHDVYQSFPPAVVTDTEGKPLYSGRVLLLPFLDQQNLYQLFDLSQPWDSTRNQAVSETSLKIFMDPSDPASEKTAKTNYLFVTGQGTMFENGKGIRISDIRDGTANTLAMVEARGDAIKWAQPDDFDATQPQALPEGCHFRINLALLADGSVRSLSSKTAPAQVRAMATIAGGELSTTMNDPAQPQAPSTPPAASRPQMVPPPEASPPPQAEREPN